MKEADKMEFITLSADSINKFLDKKINSEDEILNKEVLKALGLKQAIIYNYDSVFCGDIGQAEIVIDNIMEARFFNEKMDLNIVNNYKIEGCIAVSDDNDLVVKEDYEIYTNEYDKLSVEKYIELDEDGQAYVKYLKPCRLYRKEVK